MVLSDATSSTKFRLTAPDDNTPTTGAPTISGTAQEGQTLTASMSGIADGLTNVSHSYHWIAGATGSSYTLAASEQGQTIQVRVTFTDDANNQESLTSATMTGVAPRPPLTASFATKPSTHDGQTAFTFELLFSEAVKLSQVILRDHAFTVTDGTVTRAKRLIQGSNIGWTITVTPDSAASGAACTGDGRMLSNRLELTASGPGQ